MLWLQGLSRRAVRSEEEALSLFFAAEATRTRSGASTRSHFAFTLHLAARKSADPAERAVASRLALVDLAGCERLKHSSAGGQARREAMEINRTLAFLEQVA
jgi:kinesin family member 20